MTNVRVLIFFPTWEEGCSRLESTRISWSVQKKLGVDLDRPLDGVIEEALRDTLKKCQKKFKQKAPCETMTEKEDLTIPLASTLVEQLKILAVYEKRSIPKLIEEAVQDLLKKYTDNWFKK